MAVLKLVSLPKDYKSTTVDGTILVELDYGKISIFFPAVFAGMFEYSPGFLYRPANAFPNG